MIFFQEYNNYKNSKNEINEEKIEKALIHHLIYNLGYKFRENIKDSNQLKNNFKYHYERLNNDKFDEKDFNSWWTEFNSGDVYDRFIKLKSDPYVANKNSLDNKPLKTWKYFDIENIENNSFEIINQLWVIDNNGNKKRFDINILINGIPIIHIELKKESINVKQASKQIRTYKEIEAISDFLNFTKIFIVSNATNTYYFSNNKSIDSNYTFSWADKNNKNVNEILDFANAFLNKSFFIDFILNYFVYDESNQLVKVFRPYQYHACKNVIERVVSNSFDKKSGYIWHATGSGKTMTSFKVCELLAITNHIYRTIFLIDRLDLNTQTLNNFTKFTTNKNLVKNAMSSGNLIDLLLDKNSDKKIIMTTIQKLNYILKGLNKNKISSLEDKNILFVVDECHRSQLGEMRKNINKFFKKAINFAFTGTPIFNVNAIKGETTEKIFGPLVHKYNSLEAMNDGNVLPISYTFAKSIELEQTKIVSKYEDDLLEDSYESDNTVVQVGRIKAVVHYIKENFDKLTRDKKFNAMLACSSIPEAIEYYKLLIEITDLKLAIVFSPTKLDNSTNSNISKSNLQFIEKRIKEHNSRWDITKFNDYKSDIQNEFSNCNNRTYDLLIVVSMLLTGFDSPITNTLFLDKQLRYQGLIQSISRTNRLFSGKESGYVVSFKINEETVNEACALYSQGDQQNEFLKSELWVIENYNSIKTEFINSINELIKKFPNIDCVTNLKKNENENLEFLNKFKIVMHLFNKIKPSPEFNWDDFAIDNRIYTKYLGKYREIIEGEKDKKLILMYSDYEIIDLETIIINVNYLQKLSNKITKINFDLIPENIEEFEIYKDLKEEIQNKVIDKNQRNFLLNFIKDKDIYKHKNFGEFITLWKKYVNTLILEEENYAMQRWNTDKNTINELIGELKIKKHLAREYIKKELPHYITDELYNDDEFADVNQTIEKLISLNIIKNSTLPN